MLQNVVLVSSSSHNTVSSVNIPPFTLGKCNVFLLLFAYIDMKFNDSAHVCTVCL